MRITRIIQFFSTGVRLCIGALAAATLVAALSLPAAAAGNPGKQMGAFRTESNAVALRDSLRAEGKYAYILKKIVNGQTLFAVMASETPTNDAITAPNTPVPTIPAPIAPAASATPTPPAAVAPAPKAPAPAPVANAPKDNALPHATTMIAAPAEEQAYPKDLNRAIRIRPIDGSALTIRKGAKLYEFPDTRAIALGQWDQLPKGVIYGTDGTWYTVRFTSENRTGFVKATDVTE
jgi:hypothetical protein